MSNKKKKKNRKKTYFKILSVKKTTNKHTNCSNQEVVGLCKKVYF